MTKPRQQSGALFTNGERLLCCHDERRKRTSVYECRLIQGELELTEHKEKKWVKVEDLDCINFAAADLPIVKMIKL